MFLDYLTLLKKSKRDADRSRALWSGTTPVLKCGYHRNCSAYMSHVSCASVTDAYHSYYINIIIIVIIVIIIIIIIIVLVVLSLLCSNYRMEGYWTRNTMEEEQGISQLLWRWYVKLQWQDIVCDGCYELYQFLILLLVETQFVDYRFLKDLEIIKQPRCCCFCVTKELRIYADDKDAVTYVTLIIIIIIISINIIIIIIILSVFVRVNPPVV